jgi:iron complex outermembrane receptor protein
MTAEEIREKGILTLAELLENFTGASIVREGLFDTVWFRGLEAAYNSKILVLVNGRKINTLDWGDFNCWFGNNLDNIKQVEILKGPGSALYGANAFAGVINIITKDGKDIHGVNSKLSLGSKPGDRVLSQYYLLTYGEGNEDRDYVVSTSYWRQLGVDVVNQDQPNNLYEGDRVDASFKYKNDLVLRGGYSKADVPWPGDSFGPTPHNKLYEQNYYLDGSYTVKLDEYSKLNLRLEDTFDAKRDIRQDQYNISRTKIKTAGDLPPGAALIFSDSGQISLAQDAVGGYYIGLDDFLGLADGSKIQPGFITAGPLNEAVFEGQWNLSWPKDNFLLAGVNLTHTMSWGDYFYTDTVEDKNYAAFLQDEYHPLENLIALGGVRFDYNSNYGANVSPRGSLIYSLLPNLRFKGQYGSAFRAPSLFERYTDQNYGVYIVTGNKKLKPEKIQQSEVSAEYDLGKWLQAKAGYYYWETKDEIQFDYTQAPLYVFSPDLSYISPLLPSGPGLLYVTDLNNAPSVVSWANAESRIGHGLELESTIRPLPYTQIKLNYSRLQLYSYGNYTGTQDPYWNQGSGDLMNATLSFNYENLFFVNVYGHVTHLPTLDIVPGTANTALQPWLAQYDVSVGGKYHDLGLTLSCFNIFENPTYYDHLHKAYVKGRRVVRLSTDYTIHF